MKLDFGVLRALPRIIFRTIVIGWGTVSLSGCIMSSAFEEHREFIATNIINNPEIAEGRLIQEDAERGDFELYYRTVGTPEKAVAVWVHGTPGGWTSSGRLLVHEEVNSQVLLASIDRPGWGRSQYLDEPRLVTSYAEQAKLIAPLLQQLKSDYPGKPLYLSGHSLGGSIIPVIAADYPELVDGMLILSAGLDPELAKPRWYHRAATIGLINHAIGERMQDANVEMYALAPELEKLHDRWAELNMPIIVVQGMEDELVNPKNALYADRVLKPERSRVLRLPKQGHLTHVERTELIATCILALVEQTLALCAE